MSSNRELVAISAIINRPLLKYQHDYLSKVYNFYREIINCDIKNEPIYLNYTLSQYEALLINEN